MRSLGEVILLDIAIAVASHHLWFRPYEPTSYSTIFSATTAITLPVVVAARPFVPSVVHAFLLANAVYFMSLILSIVAYRLSPFHPLADVPGPTLCKITNLWQAYIAYCGDRHRYWKKVHDQYGMVVRVGPNEISVIDKNLFPEILGRFGMPKGPVWDARRTVTSRNPKGHQNLHAVRDLKLHSELRRPWNKAFSKESRADYEQVLVTRALELVALLKAQVTSASSRGHVEPDLGRWMGLFAFDFMGDMAFGATFDLMQNHESRGLFEMMEASFVFPCIAQNIPWIAPITNLIPCFHRATTGFSQFAANQAKKRASFEPKQRDLFYHLINATEGEPGTSPLPTIMHNVALAIVAGSDTVGTTLTHVMYYLLRHPSWMQILRQEVDEASEGLPFGTVPPPEKLGQLKVLNAVITETLRLLPPVATGLQRAPAAGSEGQAIGDMFVPEGTAVTVPPYVVHRHPGYFSPHPDEFYPERWLTSPTKMDSLEKDGETTTTLERSAFIPFSMGPANCVGQQVAMSELCYVVSLLVRNFDVEVAEGYDLEEYEKRLKDRFVMVRDKLPARLMLRREEASATAM